MEENIKLEDKLKSTMDEDLIQQALTKNQIEFKYNNKEYRLRKLNSLERQELYQKRMDKYMELLQVKDEHGVFKFKSEDELKKIYKERGIDIEGMVTQMLVLETKKKEYMKKIGEGLSTENGKLPAPDKDIAIFKNEIELLNEQIREISVKKNSLLEFSLETQTFIYVVSYITFLGTEEKEGDNWKKVWTSYNDFINGDEGLVNKASFYTTILTTNEVQL
jgi:hypothetical protein